MQTKERCVIVGGGPIRCPEWIREQLRETDYTIYCDSGLKHRDALGAQPDLIVGDFDSYENPCLQVETITLPREKDDTDTAYGLKQGIARGFREFLLVGVCGGRLDHTLGNVYLLEMLHKQGLSGAIVDDTARMKLVGTQPVHVASDCSFFSLLAILGEARKVCIRGAKYPLENAAIMPEYQYGISNECLPGQKTQVSVAEGKLLLIEVYREQQ